MNSNQKVNVIRINEILPHTNADLLGIVMVGGYQCVVKKDEYKVGDLAIYIQPDSVVPEKAQFKFLWGDKEYPEGVPERKRRVTVRRFRKEWSEGLLMPLREFAYHDTDSLVSGSWTINGAVVGEGSDVSELLGITHYEEPEAFALGTQGQKLTVWQRILKFFGLAPKPYGPKNGPGVYDVESLKNYNRVFTEGEEVIVTEKIHGSNARYMFDGKKFWIGSHKKWWKDRNNIWGIVANQYPWIEEFCRDWPGYTLRGEVTPTQTGYPYAPDYKEHTETRFFVFDVQKPGDAEYVTKERLYESTEMRHYIFSLVPMVYHGPYSEAKMKELAEGKSLVLGANHIREGIVISSVNERHVRGLGRAQLKLKSLNFLENEGKK